MCSGCNKGVMGCCPVDSKDYIEHQKTIAKKEEFINKTETSANTELATAKSAFTTCYTTTGDTTQNAKTASEGSECATEWSAYSKAMKNKILTDCYVAYGKNPATSN